MIERAGEFEAGGILDQRLEIEGLLVGPRRHGGMKEPALADVDAAEELPIAVEIGMHHAIDRALRKALEPFVQFARAEHHQRH